jgi:hypothetical protein
MKRMNATQAKAGLARGLRAVAQLGWPRQMALVLLMVALACLASAWQIAQQAQDLRAQIERAQKSQSVQSKGQAPAFEALSMAPEDTQYIKDLELLFQIGRDTGVSFGSIEYKAEANTKTPLTLRTLDLRANEDYPKIKGFVSKVLNHMPNAALQEIRIERKDAQAAQGSMLLKLTLVYQTPLKAAALN